MNINELLEKYTHRPDEYPVLCKQSHMIQVKPDAAGQETANINDTLIHYVRDTALLISRIDGSLEGGTPFDHIIYLDKSARPVSWLINMFWNNFAIEGVARPHHSYVNIDRVPWFRYVGLNVTDDGLNIETGHNATYSDFMNNIHNLSSRHLAEIRALYIEGGIEQADEKWIMEEPTILDGKRILIVDEVSRTGATLNIAAELFRRAVPEIKEITGTYFWHSTETVTHGGKPVTMTSAPVWYDRNTVTGRGIGGPNQEYYQRKYEKWEDTPGADLKKLRAQAFAGTVLSAPLLRKDGTMLPLSEEKVTRALTSDLRQLKKDYDEGRLFFDAPSQWEDRGDEALEQQGVKVTREKKPGEVRYLDFIEQLTRR